MQVDTCTAIEYHWSALALYDLDAHMFILGKFHACLVVLVGQASDNTAIKAPILLNCARVASRQDRKPTRKRASTVLNRLLSISSPTTVCLLTIVNPLHTAAACTSLLLHCAALCCKPSKACCLTGTTPCRSACSVKNRLTLKWALTKYTVCSRSDKPTAKDPTACRSIYKCKIAECIANH